MSLPASYFDAMYARSEDPWSFRSRWYEKRKRALLLASLPRARFRLAFEPGCSNGELTAELAQRCQRVLATDSSALAVELAQRRNRAHANVVAQRGSILEDWPTQKPDLIVLSEVAYYLDAATVRRIAQQAMASLADDGVVVACHWRHPVPDYPLGGDAVHGLLAESLRLDRLCSHIEADFLLDVWTVDARSVARREGLV